MPASNGQEITSILRSLGDRQLALELLNASYTQFANVQ